MHKGFNELTQSFPIQTRFSKISMYQRVSWETTKNFMI